VDYLIGHRPHFDAKPAPFRRFPTAHNWARHLMYGTVRALVWDYGPRIAREYLSARCIL